MRASAFALITASVLCVFTGAARLSAASDSTTKIIEARAQVASRTSLTVSSEHLQFVLSDTGQPAIATVDFVAGVRTHAGAEVVLTIEAARAVLGPGGAAEVDAVVSFAGDGDGAVAGSLSAARSSVAGRWVGSGRRSGRIAFALRAPVAGTYTLPVRFVLSAP